METLEGIAGNVRHTIDVRGSASGPVFDALVYRNLSTGVSGSQGWVGSLTAGVLAFIGAAIVFNVFAQQLFGGYARVIGWLFMAAGGYAFFRGLRVLQAVKQLGQSAP